ncbi:amino acid adenylation domain-containing protein [Nocardia gipuzkoensis]|uniref:amino acid adenylation domain-containing protein n=1 Tax=Nocardia gipuzkoensis TaxID=2749991 RepID=UPI001E45F3D4|nr:amino acid adenylation domain-containing protein [Nocardia gipuzkoensis]UGT71278.1 amino acid adenylation domain-containing protein [Nocardia gipuzkoensis]
MHTRLSIAAWYDSWNDTATNYPRATLDSLFDAVADTHPGRAAIELGDRVVTYRQLADSSRRIARSLNAHGVGPGDRVLVQNSRSPETIAALIGVLRLGACYVGVEPDLPATRKLTVARESSAVLEIAESPDSPIACVTFDELLTHAGDDPISFPKRFADRIAYVAFTSGSTGTPKGVQVTHRGVARLVRAQNYARLDGTTRMMHLSPLSFDASTFEIWGALLNGGTLDILPGGRLLPTEIGEFAERRRITTCFLTTGLFQMVSDFAAERFSGVRELVTGGDVASIEHVRQFRARCPRTHIIHAYGPTENTTFTTTYRLAADQLIDGLPIGRPVSNSRVYLVDAAGELAPVGAEGEIYVAGDGLAIGYLNAPDEQERRFLPGIAGRMDRVYRTGDLGRINANGDLEFVGRIDNQIKVNGYRIEPSEISAVLRTHPDVADVAVIAHGNDSASKRLVAIVVPTAGDIDTAKLRRFAMEQLPPYMVPHLWRQVTTLPLLPSGKLDSAALRVFVEESR